MNKEKTFSITAIIYASRESIWKVLLSGQLYLKAWGAELKTTWEPNTNIQFNGVWEDVEYSDKGVVKMNKENTFLKYSYWSSFWNVADIPDEYCFISYKVNPLDIHSSELTIIQDGFRDDKHYSDTVELWKNTIAIIKSESEKMDLASLNNSVFGRLFSVFDSLSEETYNKPVTNGWNAAQVVEHVIIGSSDLKKSFEESEIDSVKSYDLNIHRIRDLMLDNTVKLKTLDFLIPPFKKFDKALHREALVKIQAEINDCISTLDMRARCTAFELPPFGYMTIYEWLNFTVFHISRHISQIETLTKTNRVTQSLL